MNPITRSGTSFFQSPPLGGMVIGVYGRGIRSGSCGSRQRRHAPVGLELLCARHRQLRMPDVAGGLAEVGVAGLVQQHASQEAIRALVRAKKPPQLGRVVAILVEAERVKHAPEVVPGPDCAALLPGRRNALGLEELPTPPARRQRGNLPRARRLKRHPVVACRVPFGLAGALLVVGFEELSGEGGGRRTRKGSLDAFLLMQWR